MNKVRYHYKQNCFSIVISLIIFSYSLLMFLIGLFIPDSLYVFGVLYPILMIIIIVISIYSLITNKKRTAIDYIITTILFVSVLSINIQDFIYFYRARTGDYFYSLYYNFPGLLEFNTHWLVSVEPLKYKIENTIILFDPTLLCSALCAVISMVKYILKKKENYYCQ